MTDPDRNPASARRDAQPAPTVQLRLLETTDVHSNLLPFDYYSDNCETAYGLARTATLIHQARAEAANSVLLDNGDFLQGTPLSDMTAQPGSGWSGPHPAIMAMNDLGYDAATLGNHEFNFGLDWLQTALADSTFPITCANALVQDDTGAAEDRTLFPPYLLLDREVQDDQGGVHDLRIGVLGLVPPQITTWDHFHLKDRLTARDMCETARTWLPRMRVAGADIIVMLAHTGIDPDLYYPFKENAALTLAALPGVDAILAGHTHEVFPAPAEAEIEGVDHERGTLNGTPAVMAGFRGSHLGVLDLFLQKDARGWRVTGHRAEARKVRPAGNQPAAPDEGLKERLWPAHLHTLDLIGKPLGRSVAPLHTYLALVRNDPATQLVTRAQRATLARLVQGTPDADLPILSASAPFKTGGRGGAGYYSDVPAGDFRLRNAADLYAFPNTLCGLRLNGGQLRDWLERAAVCFNRITPGQPDQILLNPQIPGHNFDIIDGLTYRIDLTQPARYDRAGRLADPAAQRITELCHDGLPVADDDQFLMAANSFRAHGGGPYAHLPESSFAVITRIPIRNMVADFVREAEILRPEATPVWSFAPLPDTSVIFETGPGIRAYPEELTALGATDLGDSAAGFAQLRLPLGRTTAEELANPLEHAYLERREVGAGERLANPVRSGRKQP